LEAVTSKPPRLTLIELYEAEAGKRLDSLEASLSAVALADVRGEWLAAVSARLGGSESERSSVRNYAQQLDTFLARHPGATVADITKANVTAWLASRMYTSTGTRRKYYYAMRSLVGYLLDTGRLLADPLVRYSPPKKNKARLRWETEENDRLIVAASSPHYRALLAWIKATGADVSSGLRLYRRDIDLTRGVTRIPGNKTGRRLVQEATIEAWAVPILREYVAERGLMPGALVWPAPAPESNRKTGRDTAEGYTSNGVGHHHATVCERLGITGYTLKDARHSIAVRMRHKGYEFEDIAGQLGTSVYQVATVYAVFKRLPVQRSEAEAVR
jgi:site-specific recombinase XerD